MSPASGPMKIGYYLRVQGVVRGPFNLEQLQRMRAQGQLQRFHEISSDRRQWISAGSVLELFAPGSGVPTPNGGFPDVPVEPVVPIDDLPGPRPPRSWPRWLNTKVLLGVGGCLVGGVLLWLVLKNLGGSVPPPEAALKILKDNCQKCHGDIKKGGTFHVAFRDSMVLAKAGDPADKFYLVPKKPEESAIFLRIQAGQMPPSGALSSGQVGALRNWILAGAEFPGTESVVREQIAWSDVMKLVQDDLARVPEALRKQIRYFTLHNLHNNPKVSAADLNHYRAALSKIINSLSFHPVIHPPVAIDKHKMIYQVNITNYDWLASKWNILENSYPYGLNFEQDPNSEIKRQSRFIREETRTNQAVLRGDWFIASAADNAAEVTDPNAVGLYHQLLGIPSTVAALEAKMGVNTLSNIQNFRVKRAGFAVSGVSRQNRLLERHEGSSGYYWVSYDFGPGNPFSNLQGFPFGPRNKGLVFNGAGLDEHSFDPDGGEIIFSLPNKLQGYMLIDKGGKRIAKGPPEVVIDRESSEQIINGISCFGCHDKGIRRTLDQIRNGAKVPINTREVLELLYPGASKINELYDRDERDYKETLQRVYQGIAAADTLVKEPIKYSFGLYHAPVDLTQAALELDLFFDPEEPGKKIDPVDTLRKRIENNPALKRLGLGQLALKDPIPIHRAFWEQNFPQIVETLDIGRPLRPSGKSRP